MDSGAVVRGVPGHNLVFTEQPVQRWPAVDFPVVVRAKTALDDAETRQHGIGARYGVGAALLEPAVGAGADTRQDDTLLVGFAEDDIQAPFAPEREHALGVAAADGDDV